ncbi:MAG TPA: hypothetical protein VFE58_19185 [Tepidisphaeraceae bacterium]|jgi:hypothetical protein|nr:hypothetical protein [Tepidisphaeraceae bacterium]
MYKPFISIPSALLILFSLVPCTSAATLYVSKLGDNTTGSSWPHAFNSIQSALSAIPDDTGGHQILIRPDTYLESNLFSTHKGAAGKYNALIGDFDGHLGSGAKGFVVIDSSDPALGFKSYDWYTTFRAYAHGWSKAHTDQTFSSNLFDRWKFSHLYATGSDAGLFFDLVDKLEPFTIIVEDSVGIGRAFGGGVASCLSRPDEPITFRRCSLYALDTWGDTAAAYIRVENKTMPTRPDAILEDCTLVSPECSLKTSNFGFHSRTYLSITRCKLITLNFSQPAGTPTDGIIQSVQEGAGLKIDLADSQLMGYKVFGVIVDKPSAKDISYHLSGSVSAYIQFQQSLPPGFRRLPQWPLDLFSSIAPPSR